VTPSLGDVLAAARARLVTAGISEDEAGLDVDLYARRILGWDRAKVLTSRVEPSPPALEPTFSAWVARNRLSEGMPFRTTPAGTGKHD
jgi:hypothetical protein